MKSFRTTGIFALAVIALVGYVYFFEFLKGEEETKKEEASKKVFSFEREEASQIEIKSSLGTILLKKNEKKWEVEKPFRDQADAIEVSNTLSKMLAEKAEVIVEEPEDLSEFGLKKPKGEVTVFLKSGETQSVIFGTVKSYDGDPYLRVKKESSVRLGSVSLAEIIDLKPFSVRDKKIIRTPLEKAQSLYVKSKGKSLELFTQEGRWKFKNDDFPVDQNVVKSLIKDLKEFESIEIVAEQTQRGDLKKYGFKSPQGIVKIKVQDQNQLNLKLGLYDGQNFVSSSERPQVFRVNDFKAKDIFFKKRQDFLDKNSPFQFKKGLARKMILSTPEKKWSVHRKENGEWAVASSKKTNTFKVESEKIEKIIKNMQGLRFSRVISPTQSFNKDFVSSLRLQNANGDSILLLEWKNKKGEKEKTAIVKSSLRPEFFEVPREFFDFIEKEVVVKSLDKNSSQEHSDETVKESEKSKK